MMKKIGVLSLLLTAALLVQDASADDPFYLPESSYMDGAWYGVSYYDQDDFYLRIDFAVYDTGNVAAGAEQDLVEALVTELGTDAQYIYAYQVFSHSTLSHEDVASFGLLNLDDSEIIAAQIDAIGDYNDGNAGNKEPTSGEMPPDWWSWDFNDGFLAPGEFSWYLVFSSDYAPIVGKYEIEAPESEDPGVPAPEPATVILLGLGSAVLMCTRRRKSV